MPKNSRTTDVSIYIFVVILGVVWMAFLVNYTYRGIASFSWVETTAEVMVSRTERQKNMTYYPAISYRYEINGVTYNNSKVSYGPTSLPFLANESDVDTFRLDYKTGNTITIYYDPRSPEYSCLIKGTRYIAYPVFGAFVLLFIAFGIRGFYKTITRK